MNSFDWNDEHRESPADIEEALNNVLKEGNRKKTQRRSAIAMSTATALAVLTVGAFQLSGDGNQNNKTPDIALPSTSSPATTEVQLSLAAKVTQTAASALTNTKSIAFAQTIVNHKVDTGDYVNVASVLNARFRIDIDGSYWVEQTEKTPYEGKHEESYSAKTGLSTVCTTYANDCYQDHQPQLAPPAFGPIVERVDRAAKAQQVDAKEGSENDRAIWTLEYDSLIPFSTATEHVIMTVDQSTGFPVRIVSTINGKPNEEITLTDLDVNPTFTPQQFEVSLAKTNHVKNEGLLKADQIEQLTFGKSVAEPAAGILPLGTVEGFTTNEVWTSLKGRAFDSHGKCVVDDGNGAELPHARFAHAIGRKNLLNYELAVIDRSTCKDSLNMADAVTDFNKVKKIEAFTATSGTMKGATFTAYRDIDGSLVMGAENHKLLLYVYGDLNLDELKELANSLSTK